MTHVLSSFSMSNGRRIPQNTAEYARWLAREISRRHRPTWFEPDTAMFLAMALEGYASWLDDKEAKTLNFTVTAIDDLATSRVIAGADNVEVAWAAYSAAIPKQTRGRLVLHQQARIIAQHPSEVA
jgi:hypothetical protein